MDSVWDDAPRVRRARQWVLGGYWVLSLALMLLALVEFGFDGLGVSVGLLIVLAVGICPAWNACPRLARLSRRSRRVEVAARALVAPAVLHLLPCILLPSPFEFVLLPLAMPVLPAVFALLWLVVQSQPERPASDALAAVFR